MFDRYKSGRVRLKSPLAAAAITMHPRNSSVQAEKKVAFMIRTTGRLIVRNIKITIHIATSSCVRKPTEDRELSKPGLGGKEPSADQ
jgi:hypothetical protein